MSAVNPTGAHDRLETWLEQLKSAEGEEVGHILRYELRQAPGRPDALVKRVACVLLRRAAEKQWGTVGRDGGRIGAALEPLLDLFVGLYLFGGCEPEADPDTYAERRRSIGRAWARGDGRTQSVVTPATAAQNAVGRWMRFCRRPETTESEKQQALLQLLHLLAPGLDLQRQYARACSFLISLPISAATVQAVGTLGYCSKEVLDEQAKANWLAVGRDWFAGRAVASLSERYATSSAVDLFADETGHSSVATRFLFSNGAGWVMLRTLPALAMAAALGLGLSSTVAIPVVLLGCSALLHLLRVLREPTWLSAIPYRRVAIVLVGFAPIAFSDDTLKLLFSLIERGPWLSLLTMLSLNAVSLALMLAEVNGARGFAFRRRAWWPPVEWAQTFCSGRRLRRAIWGAAAWETFAALWAKGFLFGWAMTWFLADAYCAVDQPCAALRSGSAPACVWDWLLSLPATLITAASFYSLEASLAVFLGLLLQHLWNDATTGRSIQVPE